MLHLFFVEYFYIIFELFMNGIRFGQLSLCNVLNLTN